MSVLIRSESFAPNQARPSVLAAAIRVFAADPAGSLADVAAAAGIGRTTLHKQYPTRHDVLVAAAHYALGRAEEAIATAEAESDPGEALLLLVRGLVPEGDGLAFLFRQPTLDAVPKVVERKRALEPRIIALVHRGQAAGEVRLDLPDWWYVSTLYAQIYVAWEAVACGRLAPLDAPCLVLDTLVNGVRVEVTR